MSLKRDEKSRIIISEFFNDICLDKNVFHYISHEFNIVHGNGYSIAFDELVPVLFLDDGCKSFNQAYYHLIILGALEDRLPSQAENFLQNFCLISGPDSGFKTRVQLHQLLKTCCKALTLRSLNSDDYSYKYIKSCSELSSLSPKKAWDFLNAVIAAYSETVIRMIINDYGIAELSEGFEKSNSSFSFLNENVIAQHAVLNYKAALELKHHIKSLGLKHEIIIEKTNLRFKFNDKRFKQKEEAANWIDAEDIINNIEFSIVKHTNENR